MSDAKEADAAFEPRIVAIFCNWCTYTASDLAGTLRMTYAPNARIVRVMCSGRVDPQFVVAAFRDGADGVLIGGCHPNDCHYAEGNYKCLRRYQMLKRMIADMGIEPERLRLEWISAAEGEKVKRVVNEMVAAVTRLGPLGLPEKFDEWDKEMENFAEHVAAREAVAGAPCAEHGTQCFLISQIPISLLGSFLVKPK